MHPELVGVTRRTDKPASGAFCPAFGVDLPDRLDDLEEARASRDAVRLEGGRDGEADGLLGATGICHDEIGRERIETTLGALDRGVERLEVDGDVRPLLFLPRFHGVEYRG